MTGALNKCSRILRRPAKRGLLPPEIGPNPVPVLSHLISTRAADLPRAQPRSFVKLRDTVYGKRLKGHRFFRVLGSSPSSLRRLLLLAFLASRRSTAYADCERFGLCA